MAGPEDAMCNTGGRGQTMFHTADTHHTSADQAREAMFNTADGVQQSACSAANGGQQSLFSTTDQAQPPMYNTTDGAHDRQAPYAAAAGAAGGAAPLMDSEAEMASALLPQIAGESQGVIEATMLGHATLPARVVF